MSIERSIVGKIYEGKRVDEKTYHRGDAQYWKRKGKFYKWTESGGKQEIGEDEYMKALTDTSATSTSEVNSKNKEEKKESSIDSKVKSIDSKVKSTDNYVGDDSDKLNYSPEMKSFKNALNKVVLDDVEEYHDLVDNLLDGVTMNKSPEIRKLEKSLDKFVLDSDEEKRELAHRIIDDVLGQAEDTPSVNTSSYNLGDEVSYKGDSYTIISDDDGMVTLRPSYKVDTSTFDNPEDRDSFDDIHLDKSQLGGKDSDTKREEPSPIEQRRKDFENDESDYISYQDVRSFDHTSWYVDGFENTIVKNSDGSYYMQNEDYDMEFDTKGDLVKYLRDNDADYIGQDSENDY